jgi:hypothetical protein
LSLIESDFEIKIQDVCDYDVCCRLQILTSTTERMNLEIWAQIADAMLKALNEMGGSHSRFGPSGLAADTDGSTRAK